MNNLPTVSALPAHLAVLQNNTALSTMNADAVKGLSSGSWPRISIKGARFRLQDPQGQEFVVPEYYLDVILVGVNTHGLSKVYYAGAYDPAGDGTAPDCYSDNGVGPSARAGKPQCGTCAACPHNVWGSKVTPGGAAVKACADIKKVAVLIANNTDGPVFELRIPAASLANFGAYIRQLDAAGIPAASIITRLQFDTQSDYPKLLFGTPVLQEGQSPYITAEMLQAVMEVVGSDEVKLCIGENDKARDPNATLTIQAATNPIQATQAFGPVRSPLAELPPMPPAPAARAPHVSGPALNPSQVGVTPPPNPAFPHVGAQVEVAAPAKRRGRKATASEGLATTAPAAGAAPAMPPLPPFLQNAPGAPQEVGSGRDAMAPVNVSTTNAQLDDLISQAMRT